MTISFSKPILDRYVESIWTYESDGAPIAEHHFRFFADGRPGIMFQHGENPMLINAAGKLSNVFLYGQTVVPIEFSTRGHFSMVVVFLSPDALYQLFGVPANELTDSCLDLVDNEIGKGYSLVEKLLHANDVKQKVHVIEDFIIRLTLQNTTAFNSEINYALQLIRQSNGSKRILDIARTLQISERTFVRRFEQQIGVTPKIYSSIFKFNTAVQRIETGQFHSLTSLAHDLGYADQSHFIRWFKHYTGETPHTFLEAIRSANHDRTT